MEWVTGVCRWPSVRSFPLEDLFAHIHSSDIDSGFLGRTIVSTVSNSRRPLDKMAPVTSPEESM
jgi:hypothetical protein